MPVQSCNKDGMPGFKWGEQGVCFPYEPESEESKEQAREKAAEQGRAIKANEEKKFKADLKILKDVEVFSEGKHNGDVYTSEDLDHIVTAFNETKDNIRPFIKITHSEKQRLLDSEDLFNGGWIDNVRHIGTKLVVDFIDIPKKIYNLMENKMLGSLSSEIFWNLEIGGKLYKRCLAAVALLSAETSGVMNLKQLREMFTSEQFDALKIYMDNKTSTKIYSYPDGKERKEGGDKMPEDKTKELELKLKEQEQKHEAELKEQKAELDAKSKEYNEKLEASQKAAKELEEKNAKLAGEIKAEAERAKKTEIEQFTSNLVSEKLASPAMKEYIVELLSEEKKTYTFEDKEGKKEDLNKNDLFKRILKLFKAASAVNFEESSEEGEKKSKDSVAGHEKEVEQYMRDNKVDFSKAYRAVMKDKVAQGSKL